MVAVTVPATQICAGQHAAPQASARRADRWLGIGLDTRSRPPGWVRSFGMVTTPLDGCGLIIALRSVPFGD